MILLKRGQKTDYADIIACYIYYVEYHMPLRKVAENMMISHQQVSNRLEMLADYNDEMYQSYKKEKKSRRPGKKKGVNYVKAK